jgi:phosphoserine phosphatase
MNSAFCFDLDGTISSLEILPCIAAELGISDEIATLTRLTMDGHIPFSDSLRLRTMILGQVPISKVHEIINEVPLDEKIIHFIESRPENTFVVTGNLDIWLTPLFKKIRSQWFYSTAKMQDGFLKLEHVLDKGEAIQKIRLSGRYRQIIGIGDGANDVPMLQESDIAIAYGGVHPPASTTTSSADILVNDPETLCNLLKAL